MKRDHLPRPYFEALWSPLIREAHAILQVYHGKRLHPVHFHGSPGSGPTLKQKRQVASPGELVWTPVALGGNKTVSLRMEASSDCRLASPRRLEEALGYAWKLSPIHTVALSHHILPHDGWMEGGEWW